MPYLGDVNIGDVVVVKNEMTEGKMFIKRIEGIPGDTVVIKDGKLYRNGVVVDEGFASIAYAGLFATETKLGADEYFVLGDNRNNSEDSRYIGAIKKEDIKHVVIASNNR